MFSLHSHMIISACMARDQEEEEEESGIELWNSLADES